jgi:hypothetical protein
MLNRVLLAIIVVLAGLVFGLAGGLYVGWRAWPVQYHNTGVDSLRGDYRDDYVLMVATAYGWDGDLGRAAARLRQIESAGMPELVEAVRDRLAAHGGAEADLQRLNRLALDLRARPAPPIETATPVP